MFVLYDLYLDLYDEARYVKKLSDFLLAVAPTSGGRRKFLPSYSEVFTVITMDTRPTESNCLAINVSKVEGIKTLDSIYFIFKKELKGRVQIAIEDSALFSDRDLSVQSLFTSGDTIVKELGDRSGTSWGLATYDVMLAENIYLELDPSKHCRNYPK